MARLQSHQSWNPPSGNCFKLNVDAAFLSDSKKANLGMVVRDSSGTVQVCAVTKVDNIDSALQAELRAILFGLEIAQENLLTPLTVESDSLVAVKEILKGKETFCEWECIIADICDLAREFERCNFCFINRTANECAHNIAKLLCDLGDQKIWRNSWPPFFCNPDLVL